MGSYGYESEGNSFSGTPYFEKHRKVRLDDKNSSYNEVVLNNLVKNYGYRSCLQ